MADQYILRVTAGSNYDLDEHTEVPINSPEIVRVTNKHVDVELNVRIQNYRGLPRNAPSTSPYFSEEPHAYNNDQYSIAFRFTLKKPSSDQDTAPVEAEEPSDQPAGISGTDLQFGNDFDHPIRNRLPPGFGTALNIVKWWIDPGLEGDVYADEPYMYGPALSSFNAVHVGAGEHDPAKGGVWAVEGGDEAGLAARQEVGAPDDGKARMKWALRPDSKASWVWAYGQTYTVDFFNPYLDFNEFALRLPGFNLPVIRYWDGQGLRYVLRNRATGDVYLVVLFTLYLKEDVNEDGSLKPAAMEATKKNSGGMGGRDERPEHLETAEEQEEAFDEQKALEEARRKLSGVDLDGEVEPTADDVD